MKGKHTQSPFFVVAFFVLFTFFFFLLQLFFDNFFQGNLLCCCFDSRTKMLLMSNWPHTLSLSEVRMVYFDSSRKCTQIVAAKAYSDSSRSCTWIGAQGLIRLRSMIFSNKVYITTSSGVLGVRHNVYSDLDWSTRV
jgi:hypothetical protein